MAHEPISRASATRRAKLFQLAAVVAIAAAGLVLAIGLPGIKLPASTRIDPLPPLTISTPADSTGEPSNINFLAVADRLSMISNRPVLPEPLAAPTEELPVEIPPPTTPTEDTRFLGIVTLGAGKMALISKGDKQFFIPVGGKVGEQTLQSISDHSITLTGEHGSGTTTIDLAPKSSEVVTRAGSGGPGANPFAQANRGMPQPGIPGVANNKMNSAGAQAMANLRAKAAANKSAPVTPGPPMVTGIVPPQYSQLFKDPAKRQRFAEFQEKLRLGGDFKTQQELDDAAVKYTEEEFGQLRAKQGGK